MKINLYYSTNICNNSNFCNKYKNCIKDECPVDYYAWHEEEIDYMNEQMKRKKKINGK